MAITLPIICSFIGLFLFWLIHRNMEKIEQTLPIRLSMTLVTMVTGVVAVLCAAISLQIPLIKFLVDLG